MAYDDIGSSLAAKTQYRVWKNNLLAILAAKGISVSESESLKELIARIAEIIPAAALTGDAGAQHVYKGKTFYNTDPNSPVTGTLELTGDAAVGDVLAGKTFYNTALLTQRTGTLVPQESVLTGDSAVLDVEAGKTFYNNDATVKLTGSRRAVYAAGATTNYPIRYDNRSMLDNARAATFSNAIRNIITDDTRMFVCGDAHNYIRYYLKSSLIAVANTGASSNNSINSLAINDTYLMAGGEYGFARWALANLGAAATELAYGGTLYGITILGDYLYGAGGTIQKVWKVQISNMTKVAESADYGGLPRAICNDGSAIFMGGGTVCKVYKYSAVDLSKLAESAVIGDGILGLWADNTHVYAISSSGQKVVKLLASDLSTVTESAAYGGGLYSISGDANYIYAGGTTPQKVFMYHKSDLSKVSEGLAYGGDILAICT